MSIVRNERDLKLLERYIDEQQLEQIKKLVEKGAIPSMDCIAYPAFMAISVQDPKILSEPATAEWLEEINRKFRKDGKSIASVIRPHLETIIDGALEYEEKKDTPEYQAEYENYLATIDRNAHD